MSNSSQDCPKCGSANTFFSKKRRLWCCEECGHEWAAEEAAPRKLRIFLSYGHDRNAELVRRIKADLEGRGHDVWFDKTEIKGGDDWRRSIIDGIMKSDRVVSFLSKYSVREPGVCLDEVAVSIGVKGGNIQTVLVEGLQEVSPPASLSHIQWLDMHDWLERHAAGGSAWERWYQSKFEEIVAVVESAESRRFAGEIAELQEILRPISSDSRLKQLLARGFVGRKWLFDEVEAWRKREDRTSRLFCILGAPGVGKSAFAAHLAHYGKDTVIAVQFCEYDKSDHRNPGRIVKTLAFQLATRLPDYRELLLALPEIGNLESKNASELFDYLLAEPLGKAIDGGRERYLIVIDALDEASAGGRNEFVDLLVANAQRLPAWLGIVATARPESNTVGPLQGLNPIRFDTATEANRADIREYLSDRLAAALKGRPDAESLLNRILEKSEGVFLYAEYFCEDVRLGNLSLDKSDAFPIGLGGIYFQHLERQFPDIGAYRRNCRPALRAIIAAREPPPLAVLNRLFRWNEEESRDVVREFGALFFIITEPGRGRGDEDRRIRAHHKSLADFLSDEGKAKQYFVDVREGHRLLAEQGLAELERFHSGSARIADYFLAWLPSHLAELEDSERLVALLKDFDYLMARTKAGHLEQVLVDYAGTKNLPPEFQKIVEIEEYFFRSKAHLLRRGDAAWPSHKILLQLAVEHADDSPLTTAAEKWLSEGKCDWRWLRRNQRARHAEVGNCLAVLEGHKGSVEGALFRSDGSILSWSNDRTLRLWDTQGKALATLEGHTGRVEGALIGPNGTIFSWLADELRLWDAEGKALTVLEGYRWGWGVERETVSFRPDGSVLSFEDEALWLWDATKKALTVLEGHSDQVKGALFRPDGSILSWSDHELRLWDAEGKALALLEGHTGDVFGARIGPNGTILSWSVGELRLWDTEGKSLAVLEGHTVEADGPLLRTDGSILSWQKTDRTLRLWDAEGKNLTKLEGHTSWMWGALIRPDGSILSWSNDKTLRLWDTAGKALAVLEGHTDRVEGALLRSDGTILSWSADGTRRLWDSEGKALALLEGHDINVRGARLCPDGSILSWSDGNTLRYWDASGKLRALLGMTGEVLDGVLFHVDGSRSSWSLKGGLRLIDSFGKEITSLHGQDRCKNNALLRPDATILFWSGSMDTKTLSLLSLEGEELAVFRGHTGAVNGALPRPDGSILSWAEDGTLRLWYPEGKVPTPTEGHTDSVTGALFLPDSSMLTWSKDGTLRLWDTAGKALAVLEGHTGEVYGALIHPDGSILTWSADKTLRLWNTVGKKLTVLEGHTDEVCGAHIRPDGDILSWSMDKTLRLWDAEGKVLAVLEGHTGIARSALFCPDGSILSWPAPFASHDDVDKTLRLWSAEGNTLAVLEGHTDGVLGALIRPDGSILSWSMDKTLRLWDAEGKELTVLEGHTDGVRGALLRSDGSILSWSFDGTLRLWNTEGRELTVLEGHTESVRGALLRSDGSILSWSIHDHTIRLWDKSGKLQERQPLKIGLRKYPELVPDDVVAGRFHALSESSAAILVRSGGEEELRWTAESDCDVRRLFPDGRLVVTQANGQVCFLRLFEGNRAVDLERNPLVGGRGREARNG